MIRFSMLLIYISLLFFISIRAQSNSDSTIADQYFNKAEELMTASSLDSATVYFNKALKIYEGNKNWKSYFKCEFRITAILIRQREFDEAQNKLVALFTESKEKFGEENDALAYAYHSLGNLFIRKQQIDSALIYYDKALVLQRKLLGEESSDVGDTYNNIGIANFYLSNYDLAISYWKKSLSIRKKIKGEESAVVGDSYNNIAYAYQVKSDYDNALKYYDRSLRIREKLFGKRHKIISDSFINIGIVYFEKGEFDKALEFYTNSLSIRKEIFGEIHPDVADCYNNIGTVYDGKGEPKRALKYLQRALDIRVQTLGEKHTLVADSYDNIGNEYQAIGDFSKALEYQKKAGVIFREILGEVNLKVAMNYNAIGIDLKNLDEFDEALNNFISALEIYNKIFGTEHLRISETYNNIGSVWRSKGNYVKAFENQNKALAMQIKLFGRYNKNVAVTLNLIGDINNAQHDYEKAKQFYKKSALSNLMSDNFEIINLQDSLIFISYSELLKSLLGLEKIYNNSDEKDSLTFSLKIALVADRIITKVRKTMFSKKDKIDLGKISSKIYEEGIKCCIQLRNVGVKTDSISQAALYFSEQNKASVLSNMIAKANALKFAGLPDSLVEVEKKLISEIENYRRLLLEDENEDEQISLRDKIFNAERKYEDLNVFLEKKFPQYYSIKNSTTKTDFTDVQNHIDKNTAVVSYFIGENKLYILVVTTEEFNVINVSGKSHIKNDVNDFVSSLKTGEIDQYSNANIGLYEKLIAPIEDEIKGKSKLVIIPD